MAEFTYGLTDYERDQQAQPFTDWERFYQQGPAETPANPVVPANPAAPEPEPESAIAFDRSDWRNFFNDDGTLRDEAFLPENAAYIPVAVTRQTWQQYQDRFVPWEDALLNQTHYNNPGMVGEAVAQGTQQASAAIDTSQGIQQRRLQAMGQQVSAGDQARMNQSWERERTLNTADAANRIRQNIAAQSRNIAFGGTSAQPAISMPQNQ